MQIDQQPGISLRLKIKQFTGARSLQLVTLAIEQRERGIQPRIEVRSLAFDQDALVLFRFEFEKLKCLRTRPAIDGAVHRDFHGGLGRCVGRRRWNFRQIADGKRAGIRNSEPSNRANITNTRRHGRWNCDGEFRSAQVSGGYVRSGKAQRAHILQILPAHLHFDVCSGPPATRKNGEQPCDRKLAAQPLREPVRNVGGQ